MERATTSACANISGCFLPQGKILRMLLQTITDLIQDVADLGNLPMTEEIRLVDQNAIEQAFYLELNQYLAATDFILQRASSSRGNRADQIQEVISSSGDGKPA